MSFDPGIEAAGATVIEAEPIPKNEHNGEHKHPSRGRYGAPFHQFSAAMPCFFVSKMEIAGWPFFGAAARAAGTIFLDRSSLASANSVAGVIGERLKGPVPVLLFPEGTTSDGSHLLPFRSRFIAPAITAEAPITAAAIRYVIDGGIEKRERCGERELCWIGDAAFLPHLWKTLDTPGFSAEVRFGPPRLYPDRRSAASATRAEITAMRAGEVVLTHFQAQN
jgi:1-acyl-sn-glycerol-3-phosphate acyltransferase